MNCKSLRFAGVFTFLAFAIGGCSSNDVDESSVASSETGFACRPISGNDARSDAHRMTSFGKFCGTIDSGDEVHWFTYDLSGSGETSFGITANDDLRMTTWMRQGDLYVRTSGVFADGVATPRASDKLGTFVVAVYSNSTRDVSYELTFKRKSGSIAPTGEDGDKSATSDVSSRKDGQDGKDGKDGKDGQDGRDGRSGQDGQDGADGSSGSITNASLRQDCVALVNKYRRTEGLNDVERNTKQESCVLEEAKIDYSKRTAHSSFGRCGEKSQNESGLKESSLTASNSDHLPMSHNGALVTYLDVKDADRRQQLAELVRAFWAEKTSAADQNKGHYHNMNDPNAKSVACGIYGNDTVIKKLTMDFFR